MGSGAGRSECCAGQRNPDTAEAKSGLGSRLDRRLALKAVKGGSQQRFDHRCCPSYCTPMMFANGPSVQAPSRRLDDVCNGGLMGRAAGIEHLARPIDHSQGRMAARRSRAGPIGALDVVKN